jgi:hypothetical protein
MNPSFRLLAATILSLGLAAQAAVPVRSPEAAPAVQGGQVLRARFTALVSSLSSNPFGRPIHLESREGDNTLKGEVFALVEHPFDQVRDSLQRPQSWCEVMLLPFNTKGCSPEAQALHLLVGRKKDTAPSDAFRVDFHYSVKARDADYLDVALDAPSGPLGTRDYRITLEAVPVEGGRTFLHLSYAYGFGTMSRMAMSTYLATAGADKVGFSRDADGRYVGGVRGVVERNTMRYFLAIDAFLDSLSAPADARVEKRLREWFAATERYPRQLHEMEADEYLVMKRREYSRLAAG